MKAAYRYAIALWEVAEEADQTDVVFDDIQRLKNLFESSDDFARFVDSPRITEDEYKNAFDALFKDKFQPVTVNFIHLLANKGRVEILPQIIEQFSNVRNKKLGIVKAELRSADSLTEKQKEQIIVFLEKQTSNKVELTESVDLSLLGGFTVRVGDTVYDASVKHQLEVLEKRLLNVQLVSAN